MPKRPSRKKSTVRIFAHTSDRKVVVDKYVDFIADAHRLFHNCQHLLLELTTGERAFYDYLCEYMDKGSNGITIDQDLREAFADQVSRITSHRVTYSAASATKYTGTLARLGFIIQEGGGNTGYYIVNPRYAYAGSETDRKAVLQSMIQDRISAGMSIQHLINVPEQEFLKPRLNAD